MTNEILEKLSNKSITKEEIAEKIQENKNLIPEIIRGISSTKASIRYGCANSLKLISEEKPEILYPYMDFFMELLDSKYRILTWVAMGVLANLAEIDTKNKFDSNVDKYYSFLNDEYMVTVANVVGHSGKIAKAKPHLTQKITNEILKVEKIQITPHLTNECKNVIIEKAISSFDMYYDQIQNKDDVNSFVRRQLKNTRKTVRTKAANFLKKWS
jgi:hypothetical protein